MKGHIHKSIVMKTNTEIAQNIVYSSVKILTGWCFLVFCPLKKIPQRNLMTGQDDNCPRHSHTNTILYKHFQAA
jgi:hypothetical protein